MLPGTRPDHYETFTVGAFRNNLYAPAPGGERLLVAEYENNTGLQRTIRAIFNWPLLPGLR